MARVSVPVRSRWGAASLRGFVRRPFGFVVDQVTRTNLSVRSKILLSLCIVILIMSITNVLLVFQLLNYGRQYDAIIVNITTAKSISGHIKPDIDTEVWRIVAGKIDFDEGQQYEILEDVNTKLRQMMANTDSAKSRIKKEQENLKKAELGALQAQINRHFLYNTLDTIIWMTESQKTDEVIEIVRALSSFFRISLSKGKDWITIGEEVERTRSYLTIQKMHYRDILDYRIEVDGGTIMQAMAGSGT